MRRVSIEAEGFEELRKAFEELPVGVQKGALKATFRKILGKQVVSPLRTGIQYSRRTTRAIKVMTVSKDRDGIYAGVDSDAYWLRFVDKGTKVRTTKKGANRGRIVGTREISNFLDNVGDPIVEEFTSDWGTYVNEFVDKKLKTKRKKAL